MADPARDRPMTIDEYMAWENAQERKHEYVDGQVYAMAGVSRRHSAIVTNLTLALATFARRGGCRFHAVDLKLHLDRVVYYPDVMVACGPEPADEHVENDPALVVEVLSPTTARVDRREKLMAYQAIPGLRSYLIVEQDRRRVEHHRRTPDGDWRVEVVDRDGTIPLDVPPVTLSLDAIYEGVALPSPDELRRIREAADAYG